MAWLKEQKWVDTQRIAMTGISFGGIQTLLTAEKGLGIRAFVAFAPAAQSWNPVLADRLKRAVRQARSPIFHCPGAKRLQSGAKQGAGKETGEEGRS